MHEPQMHVEWIGNERNAVVVIDDFAPDPESLREDARDLTFVPMPDQYYPGRRAQAPEGYVATVGRTIETALREFYGCRRIEIQQCYYSLSMTPPDELTIEQRLPHFDAMFQNCYAVVHFLCLPEFGGTAFFRHRSSGFETISTARNAEYAARRSAEMAEHGAPRPAYVDGDSDIFDHLATIDARPNRAIIFRGNALHSGAVSNTVALPDDPMSGRLTVVSFLIAD